MVICFLVIASYVKLEKSQFDVTSYRSRQMFSLVSGDIGKTNNLNKSEFKLFSKVKPAIVDKKHFTIISPAKTSVVKKKPEHKLQSKSKPKSKTTIVKSVNKSKAKKIRVKGVCILSSAKLSPYWKVVRNPSQMQSPTTQFPQQNNIFSSPQIMPQPQHLPNIAPSWPSSPQLQPFIPNPNVCPPGG